MEDKLVWSSNMTRDNLLSLDESSKMTALINREYDREMLEGMDLDTVIKNDKYMFQEDLSNFDTDILPMIEDQTHNGLVIACNGDECFYVSAEDLKGGEYDSPYNNSKLVDRGGDIFWNNNGTEYELFALPTEYNDEDIDDPDWIMQNCDHIRNLADLDLNDDSLEEAKSKDPNELRKELDEIKPLVDEYGFEYFTSMPFSNFDDDHESIEYQYPEFAEQVKSFFKEMGILSKDEVADSDVMDEHWEIDVDEHDFNTILKSCEKMADNMSVQYEKEFKNGFDDGLKSDKEILADREQKEEVAEESLNEDVNMDKLKETIADDFMMTYLDGIDDNYAREVAAKWPQYDIDWCNQEGDNLMAQEVDEAKYNLAETIVKSLFANAPKNESLKEDKFETGEVDQYALNGEVFNALADIAYENEVNGGSNTPEAFRAAVEDFIKKFFIAGGRDDFDESLNEGFIDTLKSLVTSTSFSRRVMSREGKVRGTEILKRINDLLNQGDKDTALKIMKNYIDNDKLMRSWGSRPSKTQAEFNDMLPGADKYADEFIDKFGGSRDESLNENELTSKVGELTRSHGGWMANLLMNLDRGVDQINKRKSLSDSEKQMVQLMKELVNLIKDDRDESLNEEVDELADGSMDDVGTTLDLGDGITIEAEDQDTIDMIQNILADTPKEESLNEDTLTEPQGDDADYSRTVDWVTEATTEGELVDEIRSYGLPESGDGLKGIKITVDDMANDANGWATVTFTGDKETIDQFLADAGFDE